MAGGEAEAGADDRDPVAELFVADHQHLRLADGRRPDELARHYSTDYERRRLEKEGI